MDLRITDERADKLAGIIVHADDNAWHDVVADLLADRAVLLARIAALEALASPVVDSRNDGERE